ncbi:site-specific DNA-methyltransferase [Bradyrhizobium genomosp. III]|uniref:site-specific DNA-methyltransferase n=1 Tax=Bradyrhizobium genomosp. III TaxID=2683271 RepID=UPI0004B52C66|nr:site-specific DNA-methyltransferase [Bradyrhizobium sp. CCBAU 15615]
MAKNGKKQAAKSVETLKHDEAKRKNIPTAEYQSVLEKEQQNPRKVFYPRNRDLDPQLVWRGKDEQDWSDLVVQAPPLYIQEKVHSKVLIDDLLSVTKEREHEGGEITPDLFADFNGIPKGADKTEFYHHDQNWSNRMILGDALQVMASLAEREGLRGKVQCIYFDPPYGIKFNSNFQWSTTSRDVKDGSAVHITREPEQVKAFRDTWRDGIHSYLTYLRDRLTIARDLLTESGSIFVQIGDENVHRVRAILDEVFGDENFVVEITFVKKGNQKGTLLESTSDKLLWFSRSKASIKSRPLYKQTIDEAALERDFRLIDYQGQVLSLNEFAELKGDTALTSVRDVVEKYPEAGIFMSDNLTVGGFRANQSLTYKFRGKDRDPGLRKNRCWMHTARPKSEHEKYCGLDRLAFADRLIETSSESIRKKVFYSDFGVTKMNSIWTDTGGAANPRYVVETSAEVIKRCILMSTDPGDLVLDPTCGSGTTAYVSEQWGRRWITIDTSRVALALARARVMGARYPFYYLADSRDGQVKEAEVTNTPPSAVRARGDIRLGFVYERVSHVTSSVIANNSEIDVIWDNWQPKLRPLLDQLNGALGKKWQDWEVPHGADDLWSDAAKKIHAQWCEARLSRQKEIDASIAAKAEIEFLYDKPYSDTKKVRVAGPFTVESLSPHRILGVDENDELIDGLEDPGGEYGAKKSFPEMILENLKIAGVQQAHKEDRITFTALSPWPGDLVCAEGRYMEGETERRAAILIGPEFGTVLRADLVAAAREAGDASFDVLIACAFNYEAHTTEFNKLGRIPVLKARMNADLHMADDLKNTGKGNLFVIFGEPDIDLIQEKDGRLRVKVNGVDVFKPQTGEVISDNADGIACWFVDTDYNEESFFVRHAYFLGANDPYGALKTTLKAEIDAEAWATLNSDTSRPFGKPRSGRIAVKVINHLGDEVMKVFKVN